MYRYVLALLALVAVLAPSPSAPPKATAHSIQPLFLNTLPACVAFSVNETLRLWATALHCTTQEGVKHLAVGAPDQTVVVRHTHAETDLAILQGGPSAPALRLAKRRPHVGDSVTVEGFPMGTPQPVRFYGHVASLSFMFPEETVAVMLVDSQALPGVSGAPILLNGDVIGVFNGLYRGTVGQVGWSATWENTVAFIGPTR